MDTLTTIETGFKAEHDAYTASLKERTPILEKYSTILDAVKQKVLELGQLHKLQVADAQAELAQTRQKLTEADEVHTLSKVGHAKFLETAEREIAIKREAINDLESKKQTLNRNVDTVMAEHRTAESELGSLRIKVSAGDRRVRDLESQESILTASNKEKSERNAALDAEHETKQKLFSKLSADIAILEARKSNHVS